jgi:hypothetical protein
MHLYCVFLVCYVHTGDELSPEVPPLAESRAPPVAPPVVTMSLATKTVINPSTHAHEPVAIAALIHRSVQTDAKSVSILTTKLQVKLYDKCIE